MGVASKLLAVGLAQGASETTIYTVPFTHTTIVKNVFLCNLGTTQVNTFLILAARPGWGLQLIATPLANQAIDESSHWVVMPESYFMILKLEAGGPVGYWISGAELPGHPDVPTAPPLLIASDDGLTPLPAELAGQAVAVDLTSGT